MIVIRNLLASAQYQLIYPIIGFAQNMVTAASITYDIHSSQTKLYMSSKVSCTTTVTKSETGSKARVRMSGPQFFTNLKAN